MFQKGFRVGGVMKPWKAYISVEVESSLERRNGLMYGLCNK